MAKLMGRSAMDARKEFVIGTQESGNSPWSLSDLARLTDDQLIDRLEQVEGQGYLIKCRILWELRQRFDSDRLFGQYLNEVRESTNPAWASSSSDISRSIAAGRFCEQHKINDLTKAKIYKGAVYALSMMQDVESAGKILSEIRQKNVAVKEVERMIEQSKAVATIEQPEAVARDQEPTPGRVIQVVDNQAIESIEHDIIELPVSVLEPIRVELTDEDMAEEIYLFCKKFPISFMRLASVVKLLLTKVTMRGYGK
jgi:hypothetical protein